MKKQESFARASREGGSQSERRIPEFVVSEVRHSTVKPPGGRVGAEKKVDGDTESRVRESACRRAVRSLVNLPPGQRGRALEWPDGPPLMKTGRGGS